MYRYDYFFVCWMLSLFSFWCYTWALSTASTVFLLISQRFPASPNRSFCGVENDSLSMTKESRKGCKEDWEITLGWWQNGVDNWLEFFFFFHVLRFITAILSSTFRILILPGSCLSQNPLKSFSSCHRVHQLHRFRAQPSVTVLLDFKITRSVHTELRTLDHWMWKLGQPRNTEVGWKPRTFPFVLWSMDQYTYHWDRWLWLTLYLSAKKTFSSLFRTSFPTSLTTFRFRMPLTSAHRRSTLFVIQLQSMSTRYTTYLCGGRCELMKRPEVHGGMISAQCKITLYSYCELFESLLGLACSSLSGSPIISTTLMKRGIMRKLGNWD